jgi:Family of unknown function (DUF6335)
MGTRKTTPKKAAGKRPASSKRRVRPGRARSRATRARRRLDAPEAVETTALGATEEGFPTIARRASVGATASGGDVDANWQRAESTGEEAAGGSVATPDQDVVDEFARALGVERAPDAPVTTSQEILSQRDRLRWRREQPVPRPSASRGRRRP